jgi:16S rRNA (guanine527-N7)-methyltransferase
MVQAVGRDPALAAALADGIRRLALDVTTERRDRLLDYLALLVRWNRAYNLTAVRDPREMIPVHLLDSLSIAPYLEGERVLDLGSGPGLPGIPLALVQSERRFTLLDANGKKIRFLRQAVGALGLDNVEVLWARAEALPPQPGFDCITVRAFAGLSDILSLAQRLLRQGRGVVLAMKGQRPETELAALDLDSAHLRVIRLRVPRLDRQRHLIVMRINPR